ncbi:hypothetical protein [Legionella gresilensis]|uniref:hypothetical protein n=1 Tax=Legionella gresilensis TaxID=91823 RepID=UPI001041A84D|nr:hypothetical protein [Legionella gresilensis]
MNKVILGFSILMAGSVAFASSSTNNQTPSTNMKANWICTTNASSSDIATEKAADDKMAQQKMSAEDSFKFAAKHCRDCTKITCEVQNDDNTTNTNTNQ